MHTKHGTHQVLGVMLYCSLTAIAACLLASPPLEAFRGLLAILRSPAQLTTDAFLVGGLGGAFLNAGLVGLCCTGVFALSRARLSGVSLMAFFLTLGFSFFGINMMNIWPCILGTWLYTRMDRVPFASQVNTALFAASLSPFVSEMLWRYPLLTGLPAEPLLRILAALLTGGLAGFLMPILCRHSPNLHKGYSLYNAAAVAGYIGVMLYAVLYHAMDVLPPASASLGDSHPWAVTLYMAAVCVGLLMAGFIMNGRSFHGYGRLFFCSGYRSNFTRTLGMPLTLIHIGIFDHTVLLFDRRAHERPDGRQHHLLAGHRPMRRTSAERVAHHGRVRTGIGAVPFPTEHPVHRGRLQLCLRAVPDCRAFRRAVRRGGRLPARMPGDHGGGHPWGLLPVQLRLHQRHLRHPDGAGAGDLLHADGQASSDSQAAEALTSSGAHRAP